LEGVSPLVLGVKNILVPESCTHLTFFHAPTAYLNDDKRARISEKRSSNVTNPFIWLVALDELRPTLRTRSQGCLNHGASMNETWPKRQRRLLTSVLVPTLFPFSTSKPQTKCPLKGKLNLLLPSLRSNHSSSHGPGTMNT